MDQADARCADVRALLPELALGIADGADRAMALEHLSGCAECRGELADLSVIADDLLSIAPEAEPPVGFEAHVLDRLRTRETRTGIAAHPRRRRLGFVSGVLAAAAATAVAMVLAYGADHRLASQYRAALHGTHGRYFASARLRTRDGRDAGFVFGYQGSPSWVFYVIDGQYRGGTYTEQLVSRSGTLLSLPRFSLVAASWGIATPIPVRDIALVRLVRIRDGAVLQARLPVVEH